MSETKRKQRARRSFTPELKVSAVKLVLEEGKPIAQVVRDLDGTAFRSWVEQAKTDAGGASPPSRSCASD